MFAQRFHVLDVLVEHIFADVAARRAALAAMVEEQELESVGQRRERRLHAGMVGAGAAVNDEGDRFLAHLRSVGDQPGPDDVEVDFGIAELCAHDAPFKWRWPVGTS